MSLAGFARVSRFWLVGSTRVKSTSEMGPWTFDTAMTLASNSNGEPNYPCLAALKKPASSTSGEYKGPRHHGPTRKDIYRPCYLAILPTRHSEYLKLGLQIAGFNMFPFLKCRSTRTR